MAGREETADMAGRAETAGMAVKVAPLTEEACMRDHEDVSPPSPGVTKVPSAF
jgi:hypothetical protein